MKKKKHPKEVIPTEERAQPYFDRLSPWASRTLYDLPSDDKSGLRLYGFLRIKDVYTEFRKHVEDVDGKLGFGEGTLAQMQSYFEDLEVLPNVIEDARKIHELLKDTKEYKLHQQNLLFERAFTSLEAQPKLMELFPLLVEHVTQAGQKAAKTRKTNEEAADKATKKGALKTMKTTPVTEPEPTE